MPPIRFLTSPRVLFRALLVVVPALLVLGSLYAAQAGGLAAPAATCGASNNVGGLVFQDYNANGQLDAASPNEPGIVGVTVTAYDTSGAAVGSYVTDNSPNGSWVISVPNGTQVRVEVTGLPASYQPGAYGTDSATTVSFVQSPNCNVDVGIAQPGKYCQSSFDLVTNCYVSGNQITQTNPVLVSFPYTAGGAALPGGALPPPVDEAESDQIGTTWGIAYQGHSNNLFAAAYMKRHSGFGPNGTGAIYRIDRNVAPPAVSLFLDLNVLFPGSTGVDPHPGGTNFNVDPLSWDPVGKLSLGDIEMSEDGQTLWAMNLNDRQLYEIPIGVPPVAPPAGSINRFPVPLPTDCPVAATNIRPFGLGVDSGFVYVGMVCSAETTQNRANLRAYVYSFNPSTDTFAQVLIFPLDYPRSCGVVPGCVVAGAGGIGQADWLPWTPTFATITTGYSGPPDLLYVYPQPMLTDIVFDEGDMVLGLRDRYGDQMGYQQFSTNPADTNLYSGVAPGDILRACPSGPGMWTLETNGSCGGTTTGGAGNGEGPGGGEYYYQDDTAVPPFANNDHDELSLGGVEHVGGYPDTAETVFDVFQIYDAGVMWMNDGNGQRTRGYEVYALTAPPITFGKAAGLGDLEAMCLAAPVEIGNRVWRDRTDLTRDGVQGPTNTFGPSDVEQPIPGVTVRLYAPGGALLATAITDANGEYYFSNGTGTSTPSAIYNIAGLLLNTSGYTLTLDNPADYTTGPLAGLTVTLPDNDATLNGDARDSDCRLPSPTNPIGPGNFPRIPVNVGPAEHNNHTYDCGFHNIPTAVELLYFRVEGVSGRQVDLGWATAVEIDNFGFNLYRAPESDFSRAVWIHFEPSSVGGGGFGATYAYADTVPTDGVWWYWLADVDTQGRETLHGPIAAQTGAGALLPNRVYLPIIIR